MSATPEQRDCAARHPYPRSDLPDAKLLPSSVEILDPAQILVRPKSRDPHSVEQADFALTPNGDRRSGLSDKRWN